MKTLILLFSLLLIPLMTINAQAGIAVTPGRVFYTVAPGGENIQTIKVNNPTQGELEVGVSFADWDYETNGNNNIVEAGTLENSCSDWIQVFPDTYFILSAGESKDVQVMMKVPSELDHTIPVHTSMLFFTQLNPGQSQNKEGAAIQVTVRMGVKIYHSAVSEPIHEIDIVDFKKNEDGAEKKQVALHLKNIGESWTNGAVVWEIMNKSTGKTIKMPKSEFYTLPADLRVVTQQLPQDLSPGNYTLSATVTYGDNDVINIAEMDFSI
ncbi:hypothetical protein HCG49_00925 [Arenibacter sp. 6A1]|uniref:hypothetical protein n=1 Tax=Arenibacter sp. 6A1 TaxID=2720391 RepID=UPI001447A22E|nr:hypothetical protein [Arenibacter sp. 6A1]NKI25120.1 hypothetical protein [Arenibacter sp. 6A1]